MKKLFLFALLSLTLFYPLASQAMPGSFAPLVEKLTPAVVNISTTQNIEQKRSNLPQQFSFPKGSPFEGFEQLFKQQDQGQPTTRKATSLGSGFIIDPSGIIVTNNHVVADADEITVTLHDDTQLQAEVIGRDPKVDLAVLKVKASKKLPFVNFGDSDKMRVGDWIIAIGNPYGLGGSVSAGIISARARDINVGPFDDFLQTDAAINRGNSGGPMFNLKGEVVGINTAIFSPSGGNVGIGFAMPASLAKPVIDQILQFGKARRAWLGVKIQAVSEDIAESLGRKNEDGALVLEVIPGGPSAAAGVIAGDVILKFNGKEIEDMRKLPRVVAEAPIGESVVIQVFRNGKVKNLKITLGEMKEDVQAKAKPTVKKALKESEHKESKSFSGVTVVKLDDKIRDQYNIKAKQGLLIVDVARGSEAEERGLRPKQVILKANQSKLSSIKGLEDAISSAKKQGRNSVLLLVNTGDTSRFIPLPIR